MRQAERSIANLACLFAEYGAKQPLLGSKLRFALGRNLAYEYIARVNIRTYADDTVGIEVLERILAAVRNFSCDFLRTELGVSCFRIVLFYMNRCINIVANEIFIEQNGVLVVIAFPCHEAYKGILAEGDFAV